MKEGFIQLGRRSSSGKGRFTRKEFALSLLVVNNAPPLVTLENLSRLRDVCESLHNDAEVLIIANDKAAAGYEQLIHAFPEVRLLIPVVEHSFRQCLWLGMQEAQGQLVMVLDPGCYINTIDFDTVFRAFTNASLFAMGFSLRTPEGNEIDSIIKAFPERGYLRLLAARREYAAKSFFLRDFLGIYHREKMMLLQNVERHLHGVWAAADFFLGAWTRGWQTIVDPANEVLYSYQPESLIAAGGVCSRIRFYRNEIGFLRRNFIDTESRRFRRRYLVKTAWAALRRFDVAPGCALFIEFARKFLPGRRVPLRYEAVLSPLEVFQKLMETERIEEE